MTYLLLLSGSGRSQAGPVKDVHAKAQGQSEHTAEVMQEGNMLCASVRGVQIKPWTAFMDAVVCCFDNSALAVETASHHAEQFAAQRAHQYQSI